MRRRALLLILAVLVAVGIPTARWQWILRVPAVPSDQVTRLSLLMEICEPLEGSRVLPASDIAPMLLEIARFEPDVIYAAGQKYLRRTRHDKFDREFFLSLFQRLYWNDRSDFEMLDESTGQIMRAMPMIAFSGMIAPFDQSWPNRAKQFKRRDLTRFNKQRLAPRELDRQMLVALRYVPYQRGQWDLGDPPESLTFLQRLKKLLGL